MIVATLAGLLCGLVGTYVVLRGMSYIGHGLSHAIFGGAVASFVMNINFYVGAGVWGFIASLLIGRVARRRVIGADAAIGVVTTASFAIGLALVSRHSGFTRNFDAALFGNILGVTRSDVIVIALVFVLTGALVFLFYRPLLFTTFDPEVAEASGIPTGAVDALFSLVLAATIVSTLRILGVTLVAAALVIPPATARMMTDSFARMLGLSMAIGAVSGAVGMYLSYYLNIASGPAIVLVGASLFVLVFAYTSMRNVSRRPLPV
ncbi:MAG: manganese/iron transport system permease protein [Actinomycetota bacterium]|nr:manganese/iron transport system permease protein [Actinomycetota bacterium]